LILSFPYFRISVLPFPGAPHAHIQLGLSFFSFFFFQFRYPTHRAAEVSRAVQRATRFMRQIQRADGSWEGMWGICFT
jgi:hypothetical protein